MAPPAHYTQFVVDGSNIATEGRSAPSLEQLNEAVLAFMDEHPGAIITVVVDATFGHRISKKEVKAFDEAIANNELVAPPAGAVGRGDAFVLTIANKAGAGVLSNDSFQEFHGDYDWLFDEGRLIGGKPVPHVGWVFVARNPVRGPKSRKAVREAKADVDPKEAKKEANRRVRAKKASSEPSKQSRAKKADEAEASKSGEAATKQASPDHVNELMPFLEFVEHHPVGTSCTAMIESYASHGAYARAGDVLIYVPLRLMDDPAPRSARKAVNIGESMSVVIVGFTPDRRSIDAALPHMTPADVELQPAAGSERSHAPAQETAKKAPAKKAPAKKTAAKKAPAKKTAAKKAVTKKAPAKKTAAAKKAPAKKAAAAKKAPAKTTAAKKTAAKKTAAKKTAAKKSAAKKTAEKKTVAKKTPAKKTAAKNAEKGDA